MTLRHEPQRNGSWKLTNTNSSDGTKHQTRGRSWGAPVKPASQSIRRFIFVEINCCDCWYYISFLCISYIVNMTSCIVFCSFLCSHPFYSGFYRCFSRSFFLLLFFFFFFFFLLLLLLLSNAGGARVESGFLRFLDAIETLKPKCQSPTGLL